MASLGGGSFLVYILRDDKIANVLSHSECAAGSGEFFVQQIGRMGLEIDEAIRESSAARWCAALRSTLIRGAEKNRSI